MGPPNTSTAPTGQTGPISRNFTPVERSGAMQAQSTSPQPGRAARPPDPNQASTDPAAAHAAYNSTWKYSRLVGPGTARTTATAPAPPPLPSQTPVLPMAGGVVGYQAPGYDPDVARRQAAAQAERAVNGSQESAIDGKGGKGSKSSKRAETGGSALTPDAARLTADDDNDGTPNNQDPDSSYYGLVSPGNDAGGNGATPPQGAPRGTPEVTPTGDPRTPNDEKSDGGERVYNPSFIATEPPIGKTPDGRSIYRDRNTGKHVFQGLDGNWYDADTTSWGQGAPGNASGHGYENLSDEEKAQNQDKATTLADAMSKKGIVGDPATIAALLDDGYEVDASGNVKDPRTGAIRGNLRDPNFALAQSAANEAKARARQKQVGADSDFNKWLQDMLAEAKAPNGMDASVIDNLVAKQQKRQAFEQSKSLSSALALAQKGGMNGEGLGGLGADINREFATRGQEQEAQTRAQAEYSNLQAKMQQTQNILAVLSKAADHAQSIEARNSALAAQKEIMQYQKLIQQQMMQFDAELNKPSAGDIALGIFSAPFRAFGSAFGGKAAGAAANKMF